MFRNSYYFINRNPIHLVWQAYIYLQSTIKYFSIIYLFVYMHKKYDCKVPRLLRKLSNDTNTYS